MQNLYNGLFVYVNHIGNHLKALTLIFLNNIAEFCYGFLKFLIRQSTCLFSTSSWPSKNCLCYLKTHGHDKMAFSYTFIKHFYFQF